MNYDELLEMVDEPWILLQINQKLHQWETFEGGQKHELLEMVVEP